MGDRTGQGGEGHNEHAGAHGGLQLVAQHAGEDEQHHHAAARADKAADETDEHSAHHRLDRTFFCADALHGFLGGHYRAHNKLDAQQEGHEHREAAHGGRGHSAGHPAAHHREHQHAGHHDQAVFEIQILVFVIGIGRNGAGQHIRRQGNAHRHIGVHVQEGDEHGADDRRRAHTGKAGAKAGPHAGKKGDKNRKQHAHFMRSPLRFRPDFSRSAPWSGKRPPDRPAPHGPAGA